jgi:hypothetical protein
LASLTSFNETQFFVVKSGFVCPAAASSIGLLAHAATERN